MFTTVCDFNSKLFRIEITESINIAQNLITNLYRRDSDIVHSNSLLSVIKQSYNEKSTFDVTNVPSENENQREAKIFLKYPHIRRRQRHFQPHGCGATDGVIYLNKKQFPE